MKLFFAATKTLTPKQYAIQRLLRTLSINIIVAICIQVIVLFRQSTSVDYYSLFLLSAVVALSTIGHAIEQILVLNGMSQDDATAIASGIETIATSLKKDE